MHPFAKTPVVVQAHQYGEPFWSQYRRLVQDIGKEHVYLLWDVTRAPVPDIVQTFDVHDPDHIIRITEDECRAMNRLHMKMYGSWEAPLVHVAQHLSRTHTHADWEHFWKIEYDVMCCGNWRDTLAMGNASAADLMGVDIETYGGRNRNWCHWGELTGEIARLARMPSETKGFFPVMRISRRGTQVLENNFHRSSGYVECYLATILKANGCVVEAFPVDMFGIYFNAVNLGWTDWVRMEDANRGKNTLVHPVKIQPSLS